jgi:hypothetical protein
MNKSFKFGDRILILSPLEVPIDPLPEDGYLVLLPASSEEENIKSLEVACFYMGKLCKEFCCVGANAAKLEEEIDTILENNGSLIPTTAVLNGDDACDYFLFGADAGVARYLFAPIEGHDDLVKRLITMIQAE